MGAVMKLKNLQGCLQQLKGFNEPKIELEQYETPPHIAAIALYTIQTQHADIEGNLVLDAGCGPGALSIGAALLGAGSVMSIDIDGDALDVLKENVEGMEVTSIDALQVDFLQSNVCRWESHFDTVLMNPPFGTKSNAGMDLKFLRMGAMLTCNTVYSLHKTATRPHIKSKVKEWGLKGSVIAELKYDLPATYRFHRKHSVDIAVDLWRVHHS